MLAYSFKGVFILWKHYNAEVSVNTSEQLGQENIPTFQHQNKQISWLVHFLLVPPSSDHSCHDSITTVTSAERTARIKKRCKWRLELIYLTEEQHDLSMARQHPWQLDFTPHGPVVCSCNTDNDNTFDSSQKLTKLGRKNTICGI